MDPGPTISRPYTRHKWVGRMICSHAIESACAHDSLRLPEYMTIIKNRTDNLRFSFPLLNVWTNISDGVSPFIPPYTSMFPFVVVFLNKHIVSYLSFIYA